MPHIPGHLAGQPVAGTTFLRERQQELQQPSPLFQQGAGVIGRLARLDGEFQERERLRLAENLARTGESQRRQLQTQVGLGALGGPRGTVAAAGARGLEAGLLGQRAQAQITLGAQQRGEAFTAAQAALPFEQERRARIVTGAQLETQIQNLEFSARQENRTDLANTTSFLRAELERARAAGDVQAMEQAQEGLNMIADELGVPRVEVTPMTPIQQLERTFTDIETRISELPEGSPFRSTLEGILTTIRGAADDTQTPSFTTSGGFEVVNDIEGGTVSIDLPGGGIKEFGLQTQEFRDDSGNFLSTDKIQSIVLKDADLQENFTGADRGRIARQVAENIDREKQKITARGEAPGQEPAVTGTFNIRAQTDVVSLNTANPFTGATELTRVDDLPRGRDGRDAIGLNFQDQQGRTWRINAVSKQSEGLFGTGRTVLVYNATSIDTGESTVFGQII